MVVSASIVYPQDCLADLELQLTVAALPHERIIPHSASLGKDWNSKFEVWLLPNCFHTIIKLKTPKLNHHKSGTICIAFCFSVMYLLINFINHINREQKTVNKLIFRQWYSSSCYQVSVQIAPLPSIHTHNFSMYLILLCLHNMLYAAAAAMSLQSCLTLCDPIDGSLPGSAIPGILQVRTLAWIAISFSNT